MDEDLQDDSATEAPEEDASDFEDFDPKKAEFSFRDITNFLRGRDVMVAREVDHLCRQFRESPEGTRNLADYFNKSVAEQNFVAPDPTSTQGIAMLKVMQQPEFKEIRDHLLRVGDALKLSTQAMLDNKTLQQMDSAVIYDPEKDVVKISPEASQILICDPAYMDPIVTLKHQSNISELKLSDFERAVALEERRLDDAVIDDVNNDTDAYNRELESTAPVVNELIHRVRPGPGLK